MASYQPPIEKLPIFNTDVYIDGDEPLTYNTAVKKFLRYPYAQGTENLLDTNVNGKLTVSGTSAEIAKISSTNLTPYITLGEVNGGVAIQQENVISGSNILDSSSFYGDIELGTKAGGKNINSSLYFSKLWDAKIENYRFKNDFTNDTVSAPLLLNYELSGDLDKTLLEFGYNGTKIDSLTYKNTTKKRMNQELSTSTAFEAVNGYYSLAKNTAKIPNQQALTPLFINGGFVIEFGTTGTLNYLSNNVCWSPLLNLFLVANFQGGSISGAIRTSPNGITWTTRPYTGITNTSWSCAIWCSYPSNRFLLFNNSNGDGDTNKIFTSTDGINWSYITTPSTIALISFRDACYSPELNTVVAVSTTANATTSNNIIYSTNGGATFSAVADVAVQNRAGVCWSPELGIFLTVGKVSVCYTSTNGITWTAQPSQSFSFDGAVAWSSELGLYAVSTNNATNRIATSPDGINWTLRSLSNSGIGKIIWAKEVGMFISYTSTQTIYSYDGITWFSYTQTLASPSTICWAPEISTFCAIQSGSSTTRGYVNSLNSRIPTYQNVFNNTYNSISNTGDWTYNRILFSSNNGVRLGTNSGLTTQGNFAVAIGNSSGTTNQGASSVAVGANAGSGNQSSSCVAIGNTSGFSSQASGAVAIGDNAGRITQGTQAIAIGQNAGRGGASDLSPLPQGIQAIAIGLSAGYSSQGTGSVAIGTNSGSTTQGNSSVAVGGGCGQTSQGINCVAIGASAGQSTQGTSSVAIGQTAGQTTQGSNSVAIGTNAGNGTQGATSVAIGNFSAFTGQGDLCVAVGNTSGRTNQGTQAVAVGADAGRLNQGSFSVAIGLGAGRGGASDGSPLPQGTNCIAIGNNAGYSSQSNNSIAIGRTAGQTSQGGSTVAIGYNAGNSSQASNAVAIGLNAGQTTQSTNAISIGNSAGTTLQGAQCIAIGQNAGNSNQALNAIAIGATSGQTTQGQYATALGWGAGNVNQSQYAVAIGTQSGQSGQGDSGIAIGNLSGTSNQGANSVAIGAYAGASSQGSNSIAIGANAGDLNQHANSIILNASGVSLSSNGTNRLFISPIRGVAHGAGVGRLIYDPTTFEITYSTN